MTTKGQIDFFFKPESIALIGVSPNSEKLSCTILENLLKNGVSGEDIRKSGLVDTFFISSNKVERPPKGRVSVLTQSGSFAAMILEEIANEEARVARVVSYGNKVDVDEKDCLEFLAGDEATKAVAIYIESVGNGRSFLAVCSSGRILM